MIVLSFLEYLLKGHGAKQLSFINSSINFKKSLYSSFSEVEVRSPEIIKKWGFSSGLSLGINFINELDRLIVLLPLLKDLLKKIPKCKSEM
jgi:hypothetical protein